MIAISSVIRSGAAQARAAAGRVAAWWLAEFLAILPQKFSYLWTSSRGDTLIVAANSLSVDLALWSGGRLRMQSQLSRTNFQYNSVDNFLASANLSRSRLAIWVQLSADRFFGRTFDIPSVAENVLGRLAATEIERKTPFGLSDIFHGFTVKKTDGGVKLRVHQWIIKRSYVDEAIADAGLKFADLAGVMGPADSGVELGTPAIALKGEQRPERIWTRSIGFLAASAVLLALLGFMTTLWRQQQELDQLEIEISAARRAAMEVSARAELLTRQQSSLTQLHEYRAAFPTFVDVWEEVSRILPQDSWLTELRMAEIKSSERNVFLDGFSTAATSLVGLLDQSPYFAQTALTAPIAPDPAEQRERFAVQSGLKPATKIVGSR